MTPKFGLVMDNIPHQRDQTLEPSRGCRESLTTVDYPVQGCKLCACERSADFNHGYRFQDTAVALCRLRCDDWDVAQEDNG